MEHQKILSIDVRGNPGYENAKKHNSIMKYAYLRNIRTAIAQFYKDGTRIKLEWVYPTALGLAKNNLDERTNSVLP